MTWIALKMLTGDRAKYLGIVFGVSFASLLISQGLNVVFVSRQLEHADPNVTLGTYAHLYARADHATTARAALDASHVALTQSAR